MHLTPTGVYLCNRIHSCKLARSRYARSVLLLLYAPIKTLFTMPQTAQVFGAFCSRSCTRGACRGAVLFPAPARSSGDSSQDKTWSCIAMQDGAPRAAGHDAASGGEFAGFASHHLKWFRPRWIASPANVTFWFNARGMHRYASMLVETTCT